MFIPELMKTFKRISFREMQIKTFETTESTEISSEEFDRSPMQFDVHQGPQIGAKKFF